MENRQQEILSEIKAMMASVRNQLELLDAKMAELQNEVDPQVIDIVPLEIPVEVEEFIEPAEELFEAPAVEVVVEPMPEVVPEVEKEAIPEAVIDRMISRQAWRTDRPGAPVKDVRGAIALMDRVLFINGLFGTDPMLFQDTLTRINQLQTLKEAVSYLMTEHPEWDFDSEIVYRFMMAVRRKITE